MPFKKAMEINDVISHAAIENKKILDVMGYGTDIPSPFIKILEQKDVSIFDAFIAIKISIANLVIKHFWKKVSFEDVNKYIQNFQVIELSLRHEYKIESDDAFCKWVPEIHDFVTYINNIRRSDPNYWSNVYAHLNLINVNAPPKNEIAVYKKPWWE